MHLVEFGADMEAQVRAADKSVRARADQKRQQELLQIQFEYTASWPVQFRAESHGSGAAPTRPAGAGAAGACPDSAVLLVLVLVLLLLLVLLIKLLPLLVLHLPLILPLTSQSW